MAVLLVLSGLGLGPKTPARAATVSSASAAAAGRQSLLTVSSRTAVAQAPVELTAAAPTSAVLAAAGPAVAAGPWGAANDYVDGSITMSIPQLITFTSTPPAGAVVGGPTYIVTATGGASGQPVVFSIDGSAASVCSISGSTVSFTATGTCVVDANQAGDATYDAAPQAQQTFPVGAAASADLQASITGPASAVAGDPANATYVITLTNHGPDDAATVFVADTFPSGETFVSQSQTTGPTFTLTNSGISINDSIASLASGASATFAVTVHIASSVGDRTVLSNTAVAGSSTTDPSSGNNISTVSTLVHAQTDLALTMTAAASTIAGDPANLVYTITVVNHGPSDAQGVGIDGTLSSAEAFVGQSQTAGPTFSLNNSGNEVIDTISTLAAGVAATFTVTVHVSSSVAGGTILTAEAFVGSVTTETDVNNDSATVTTVVGTSEAADLSVSKLGPPSAVAGDPANLTYTIQVANNGPGDALGVVLTDTLPVGETLASQTQTSGPTFTLTGAGDGINDTIAELPAGVSAAFTLTVHVSPSVLEGTIFSNTATVGSATADPDSTNNTSTANTLVHAHADLAISKTGPAETIAGDPANVTYSITVINNGFSDAQRVVLADVLPAGETFVSQAQTSGPTFAQSSTSTSITDGIATLASGASASFTVVVHVSPSVLEGTVLSDTATVSSSTTDPIPANNSSTASALVHAHADLAVVKTGPSAAVAGDPLNLSYTITVTNNGPSDAQGVILADALPAGETFVSQSQTSGPTFAQSSTSDTIDDNIATLASGAAASFTVVVRVSSSVPEGTVLSDTATVSSSTTDPVPANNSSTASTLVHAPADLAVIKIGPAEAIAGDPANLAYTVAVVNNGPGDAQAVSWTDSLPAGETLVSQSQISGPAFALSNVGNTITDSIATLPAGALAEFTVTVHVSPSVIEGTVFSNTATVLSATADPDPNNNSSTASTLVHAHADLAISKTGPAETVAGDPANVAYSITVTNNGPSDAQVVTLNDVLPAGETLVSQSQTSGPAFAQSSTATSISDTIGTLAAGATASFTVVAHVSPSVLEGTVFSNTATVGSATTDPNPTNNSSTANTLVHAHADLAISKTGPAEAIAGDPSHVTYAITVTNNGPSDAQVVTLNDALPAGETFVSQGQTSGPAFALSDTATSISDTIGTLAAGATASFTVVAHVSASVMEGTVLSNTAAVGSATTDPNPTNNSSTASTLVLDARITVNATNVSAIEGATFVGAVTTFADPDSSATASEYTATIDWGDGTTSSGTITGGSGIFVVSGGHTFGEEGSFTVTVTVTDADLSNNAATVRGTATVADGALSAAGAAVSGVEGASFSGKVASFTDADPNGTLADYSASIDWGDGTTSAGTLSANSNGGFDVAGSHVYGEEGSFTVKVLVKDSGGSQASSTSQATIADAALTATGSAVSGVEGASASGKVATFTDADPNGTLADYSASIDWGDGTTSAGTLSANSNGGFDISGSHVYGEEGSFTVAVVVKDSGGSQASSTSQASIADATLTAAGSAVSGVEGASFSGTVATFTDADPNGTATDYSATIDWGDGTPTSTGTVSANSSGGFNVSGAHAYGEEGSFTITVVVNDSGGSQASGTSQAIIADAPLTATGSAISGVEGTSFSGTVATFIDADPNGAVSDYTATINWGDGTTSAGTVSANSSGAFNVSGGHTYAEDGTHTFTVAIVDTPSNVVDASGTARVADAALSSVCAAPAGAIGSAFSGATATFTDASPTGTLGDFSATIDWGDGTTSAGTITGGPGNAPYTVKGTHTYTTFGPHTIKTTVTDVGGSATATTCPPVFVVPPSTAPPCDLDAGGAIRAMNGDTAVFYADVTPPSDVDEDEDGRASAPFENTVVYADLGPADRFVLISTQILAVTCTDSTSATIYGAGTLFTGGSPTTVFFILDLGAGSLGQPSRVRLQVFGSHPYDSGTQTVLGSVQINREESD